MNQFFLITTLFSSLIFAAPFIKTIEPIVIPLTQFNLNNNPHVKRSFNSLDDLNNTKRSLSQPPPSHNSPSTSSFNYIRPRYLYYGSIMVGSPPKPFYVTFETANFEIFIPSFTCYACNASPRYDPTQSTTSHDLNKHFQISTISGYVYSDFVGLNGLNVSNQIFGAYDSLIDFQPSTFITTGVLGLPHSPYTKIGGPHFFQNLILNRMISKAVFGFFLGHDDDHNVSSHIILGGFNTTLASNLSYNKVVKGDFWVINLDSIKMNGKLVTSPSNGGLLDTGNEYIVGPLKDIENIYSEIKGWDNALPSDASGFNRDQESMPHYYTFGCGAEDTLPKLSFVINKVEYPILQTDLIYSFIVKNPNRCNSVIAAHRTSLNPKTPWTLGIPFLKNVYTVFDLAADQVGFASTSTFASDF